MNEQIKTEKWIIDCDPGIDDMGAICYLASRVNVEILLISNVNGNVSLENVTSNSKKIMKWMNIKIPIHTGASIPITNNRHALDYYHCLDGLGGIESIMSFNADDIEIGIEKSYFKIIELAEKYPNEINLLLLGPLTNIAIAYNMHPRIATLFKSVYMMGGCAFSKGNINPTSEFNYYFDYVATKSVLTHFKNIIITPWEPCADVGFTTTHMEQIKKKFTYENGKIQIFDIFHSIVEKYTTQHGGLQFCDLYSIIPFYNRKSVQSFVIAKVDISIDSHNSNGMCVITQRKVIKKDFNTFMTEEWENYRDKGYHIIVEKFDEVEVSKEYESIFI